MATASKRGLKTPSGGASDDALIAASVALGRVVVVPATLWEREDAEAITIARIGEAVLPDGGRNVVCKLTCEATGAENWLPWARVAELSFDMKPTDRVFDPHDALVTVDDDEDDDARAGYGAQPHDDEEVPAEHVGGGLPLATIDEDDEEGHEARHDTEGAPSAGGNTDGGEGTSTTGAGRGVGGDRAGGRGDRGKARAWRARGRGRGRGATGVTGVQQPPKPCPWTQLSPPLVKADGPQKRCGVRRGGPSTQGKLDKGATPMHAINKVVPRALMDQLFKETNDRVLERDAKPFTRSEFEAHFALWALRKMIKLPTVKDYFSEHLGNRYFIEVTRGHGGRARFELFLACIAAAPHDAKGIDKVMPALDLLRRRARKLWVCGRVVHVDEYGKAGHHRAPTGFVLFNKDKPSKFHYEYLFITDADFMYTPWFLLPQEGWESNLTATEKKFVDEYGKRAWQVVTLAREGLCLGKNRVLTADRGFTTPRLAHLLSTSAYQLLFAGTANGAWLGAPDGWLAQQKKLVEGKRGKATHYSHRDYPGILLTIVKDRVVVPVISYGFAPEGLTERANQLIRYVGESRQDILKRREKAKKAGNSSTKNDESKEKKRDLVLFNPPLVAYHLGKHPTDVKGKRMHQNECNWVARKRYYRSGYLQFIVDFADDNAYALYLANGNERANHADFTLSWILAMMKPWMDQQTRRMETEGRRAARRNYVKHESNASTTRRARAFGCPNPPSVVDPEMNAKSCLCQGCGNQTGGVVQGKYTRGGCIKCGTTLCYSCVVDHVLGEATINERRRS